MIKNRIRNRSDRLEKQPHIEEKALGVSRTLTAGKRQHTSLPISRLVFSFFVCPRVQLKLPPFSLSLNSSLTRDSGLFLPASSFPLALELCEPSSQSSTKTDCSRLRRDSLSERRRKRGVKNGFTF